MKFEVIGVVIAIVTIFAGIGFICAGIGFILAGNGFDAALCLVFGLMASGILQFLAEMKGGAE